MPKLIRHKGWTIASDQDNIYLVYIYIYSRDVLYKDAADRTSCWKESAKETLLKQKRESKRLATLRQILFFFVCVCVLYGMHNLFPPPLSWRVRGESLSPGNGAEWIMRVNCISFLDSGHDPNNEKKKERDESKSFVGRPRKRRFKHPGIESNI